MPHISSMDSTYHAAQDLIYVLQNPALKSLLVKLGHLHKEALKTINIIFRKAKPPIVPPRVTVMEVAKRNSKKRTRKEPKLKGHHNKIQSPK